ncbi:MULTISPECIES: FeoC-like transcriptional regulator [Vibrio]|uniref:FeoC-like transcriptional regulator n=1 Tax=Vibrio ostreae TaxID=2841925 RepID=A0A975UCC8_9VIBR|nr:MULTISPECIES: FeoC-like transcriptional regulator [Vibrio]QXO18146.1 FeoC-like transcriptional regulator [Vibrio ostreae]
MILNQLKQTIAEHGSMSRKELARRFALSEDGVDAMLSVWIRKGVISRFIDTNCAQHVTRVRYAINQAQALSVTVTM